VTLANRLLFIAATLGALSACALAGPSPVGTWKGHVTIDGSKLPKAPNPQVQKARDQQIAQAGKTQITMTVKSNKTFTVTTIHGGPQSGKPQAGTWTQSGSNVTLTGNEKGPDGKLHPQTFTLSANGKTLSTVVPGGIIKVVLTRQ